MGSMFCACLMHMFKSDWAESFCHPAIMPAQWPKLLKMNHRIVLSRVANSHYAPLQG